MTLKYIICSLTILLLLYLIRHLFTLRYELETSEVRVSNYEWTILNLKRDCPNISKNCINESPIINASIEVPPKFDWRKENVIGPVLDQKGCNGCWAFSIVGLMETMSKIQGIDWQRRSIQQLIDCSKYNKGCLGGDVPTALDYLCKNKIGITTEENYPLKLIKQKCETVSQNNVRRIRNYCVNCDMKTEDLMAIIRRHGPVIVVVNAMPWFNYISGIIKKSCYRSRTGYTFDHVVQIVGYDTTDDVPYFIIKNSWGDDWGEDGYIRIAMYNDLCGINDIVIYLNVV